jgi:pimeloyl-ACP methyl ester carboxylesterase
MANYVLVHGGDRDGSIWQETADLLTAQGHRVFCPSMQSVTTASLQENIQEVIAVIEKNQLTNIILIGHSYGGFVITGVADKVTTKIAKLIYVDSFVPKNGTSLYGMMKEFGFDYQQFGLTPDKACLEELFFDEPTWMALPKAYIRCLQSEFFAPITPVYNNILANIQKEHWLVFALEAKHGCMFTHPKELAVIFAGINILVW